MGHAVGALRLQHRRRRPLHAGSVHMFAVGNRIHVFAVFKGFYPRFAWGEEPFLRFTHGKVLRFGGAVLQFCTGKMRVSRLKAATKRGKWSG